MKSCLGLLLFTCLIWNCAPSKKEETSISLLESAFENSKVNVDHFLKDWSEYSKNMSCENTSQIEKEFLQIHRLIFNPFDYKLFGREDWTWTRYVGSKYIVVQTEIPYKIVSNVDTTVYTENDFTDTLKGFCPKVEFDNVTTLVLSPSYKKALENFFGSYENGKLVNEQGRETFREKKRFVDDFLPLAMGYDYKVILTHPLITGIEISKDFQFAKVDFQLDESGLQSILRKEKSKWVILGTKTVWIE
jgi:hypothetical protein